MSSFQLVLVTPSASLHFAICQSAQRFDGALQLVRRTGGAHRRMSVVLRIDPDRSGTNSMRLKSQYV
jgi:hypothetical protein